MRKRRIQTAVGHRMKAAAQARRLRAADLAARLGVEKPTVYRWWNGERNPEEEMLDRYADLVGRTAEFLLTGVEPPNGSGGEPPHGNRADPPHGNGNGDGAAFSLRIVTTRQAQTRHGVMSPAELAALTGEVIETLSFVQQELQRLGPDENGHSD